MRFTFPNGEHDPIELSRGNFSIGSDAGDTARLADAGLKPGHARIELQPERRLCALRLAPGALAYVNARPVRGLALLRAGDVVMLNRVRLQVQSAIAAPAPGEPEVLQPRDGGARIVLRCVAGPQFGRSFRFEPSLSLGRSERADICIEDDELAPIHVRLHWLGDRCLAQSEGEGHTFELNGQRVSLAWMLPGDQLRVGSGRYVLEAPGLRAVRREDPHTPVQSMRAVSVAAAAAAALPAETRSFNFGWLILAALAIAGGLVAMFLYAPG
jgi:hypothetical protein